MLLEHNAKVYITCRSPEKAAQAVAELKALTGKDAIPLQMDLSDLASVKRAVLEFLKYVRSLMRNSVPLIGLD